MLFHGLCIVIGLLAITAPMFSLTRYSAEAQTIPIPDFAPKAPETTDDESGQTQQSEAEPEPPRETDFALKIQLEPSENEFLEGYYDVSDFAIAINNSSELCPTGDCQFELDGGEVTSEFTPGERALNGKLRVNTGDSTKILNLYADWQTIEERELDGETVQVVEGTFGVGPEQVSHDYQATINGTLTPDGNDLILEAHGIAGSPYTYLE